MKKLVMIEQKKDEKIIKTYCTDEVNPSANSETFEKENTRFAGNIILVKNDIDPPEDKKGIESHAVLEKEYSDAFRGYYEDLGKFFLKYKTYKNVYILK